MPELPELEVTKARLRLTLAGRQVTGITLRQPFCLKTVEPPLTALAGAHFQGVARHGKFLCLSTDKKLFFCVHLMLTGELALVPTAEPMSRSHLLALHLDDSTDLRVIETGTKHRVAVHVVTDPKQIPWIAQVGLDPMAPEFTLAHFRSRVTHRNQTVKNFLTNQRSIAGIGNCYSDEILFEARLSPLQLTGNLKQEEVIRLFAACKKVLADAIIHLKAAGAGHNRDAGHYPFRSDGKGSRPKSPKPEVLFPTRQDRTFLRVHSRLGEPCFVCGSEIRRVSYVDSTTYYCPGCQTGGNILADRRFSKFLK